MAPLGTVHPITENFQTLCQDGSGRGAPGILGTLSAILRVFKDKPDRNESIRTI